MALYPFPDMDKQTLRDHARRVPDPTEEQSAAVRTGLRNWLASRLPGTIAAYLAMGSEVDVAPLFDALPGWRWVLVRVEDDLSVTFRDRDLPREVHPLGMSQPIESGEPVAQNQIDVYLVPGVAFDVTGARLGRGGGFYDRILAARRPDAAVVGVSVDARTVARVPREAHDQTVQFLATESGVRECLPTS